MASVFAQHLRCGSNVAMRSTVTALSIASTAATDPSLMGSSAQDPEPLTAPSPVWSGTTTPTSLARCGGTGNSPHRAVKKSSFAMVSHPTVSNSIRRASVTRLEASRISNETKFPSSS